MGQGLITAKGALWKRHRVLMQPTFHRQLLERFVDGFAESSDFLVKLLSTHSGRDIDYYLYVVRAMNRATMQSALPYALDDGDESAFQVSEVTRSRGHAPPAFHVPLP